MASYGVDITKEQETLAKNIQQAIASAFAQPCPTPDQQSLADRIAGRSFAPTEKEGLVIESLKSSFIARYKLLKGSLSGSEVQELLNSNSRMTHINRVRNKTLLAVKDNGVWKFPAWQFDAQGDDGVVPGLIETIKALDMSNIAKISWITSNNSHLEDKTPLAMLKEGKIDEVIDEAIGIGNL